MKKADIYKVVARATFELCLDGSGLQTRVAVKCISSLFFTLAIDKPFLNMFTSSVLFSLPYLKRHCLGPSARHILHFNAWLRNFVFFSQVFKSDLVHLSDGASGRVNLRYFPFLAGLKGYS